MCGRNPTQKTTQYSTYESHENLDLFSLSISPWARATEILPKPLLHENEAEFKSAIEFIVSSENFIFGINIKERTVFHSFIMLDLDIFQKLQHKK